MTRYDFLEGQTGDFKKHSSRLQLNLISILVNLSYELGQ